MAAIVEMEQLAIDMLLDLSGKKEVRNILLQRQWVVRPFRRPINENYQEAVI